MKLAIYNLIYTPQNIRSVIASSIDLFELGYALAGMQGSVGSSGMAFTSDAGFNVPNSCDNAVPRLFTSTLIVAVCSQSTYIQKPKRISLLHLRPSMI